MANNNNNNNNNSNNCPCGESLKKSNFRLKDKKRYVCKHDQRNFSLFVSFSVSLMRQQGDSCLSEVMGRDLVETICQDNTDL